MVPEINVQELAEKLKRGENFTILDVREHWETNLVKITDERVAFLPLSQIARERKNAFPETLRDPAAEIIVMCHHGIRSANVTAWMRENGWQNVFSLAGGIDAYAERINPSVGLY